eukprot:3812917-Alexandrium_andersonii.AAC.1
MEKGMRLRSQKAPEGGRNVLQGLESAENADPFSCSSGCPRRAGARSVETLGPPLSADSKPWRR